MGDQMLVCELFKFDTTLETDYLFTWIEFSGVSLGFAFWGTF